LQQQRVVGIGSQSLIEEGARIPESLQISRESGYIDQPAGRIRPFGCPGQDWS
jgi:hypothetical protein